MTLDEAIKESLRELVHEAIAEAVRNIPAAEPLLTIHGLALHLQCSVSTVYKLLAEGMPKVSVGDKPRFLVSEVLPWLRARGDCADVKGKREDGS